MVGECSYSRRNERQPVRFSLYGWVVWEFESVWLEYHAHLRIATRLRPGLASSVLLLSCRDYLVEHGCFGIRLEYENDARYTHAIRRQHEPRSQFRKWLD